MHGLQVVNPRAMLELNIFRSRPVSVEAPLGPGSTIKPIDDLLVFVIAIENRAVGWAEFPAPGEIICRLAARTANVTPDAGVKQAFRDEMDGVARQRAAPAEVFAAAARYLEPDEIQRGAAPAYQADVMAALREAEDEHERRQAGPSADSAPQPSPAAPDEAAGAEVASAPGEPTLDDMESALASIASGVDAAGDDLAARCAGRDFENDPPLAFMCLGQLASGGPTTIHFASFRKLACAQASGKPGYVCDYSLSVNLDSARDIWRSCAVIGRRGRLHRPLRSVRRPVGATGAGVPIGEGGAS